MVLSRRTSPARRSSQVGVGLPLRLTGLLILFLIGLNLTFVLTLNFRGYGVLSNSMSSILQKGDYILVQLFDRYTPKRGDIVVIKHPKAETKSRETFTKRVIGLPGEMVEIKNGNLYVDDTMLRISTWEKPLRPNYFKAKVEAGEVFVMGDKHSVSYDSRSFGPVDVENVIGEAVFIFWPLTRFGEIEETVKAGEINRSRNGL